MRIELLDVVVLLPCALIVLLGATMIVGELIDIVLDWINRHA